MANLDACVTVARTSLSTTPKAGAGSIQRADSEMQLLAECHSRRQRCALQESPMGSRPSLRITSQVFREDKQYVHKPG